jgi:hypothetical protein
VAVFDDDAPVHEHHSIGDAPCETHLVGDDEHRHSLFGELAHDAQYVAHELGVEGARCFVEEHHLGLHRQRTCDRDPLLLAARELRRVGGRLLGEADAIEQLPRLFLGDLAVLPENLAQGDGDVVEHRHVGEQIERLENHAR